MTKRQQALRKAELINNADRLVRQLLSRQVWAARRERETYDRVTATLTRAQTRLARRVSL